MIVLGRKNGLRGSLKGRLKAYGPRRKEKPIWTLNEAKDRLVLLAMSLFITRWSLKRRSPQII